MTPYWSELQILYSSRYWNFRIVLQIICTEEEAWIYRMHHIFPTGSLLPPINNRKYNQQLPVDTDPNIFHFVSQCTLILCCE